MSGLWILFTVVVAPYLALHPQLYHSEQSRMKASAWMAGFEIFATLFSTFSTGPLIEAFDKQGLNIGIASLNGFQVSAVLYAILGGASFFISMWGIKDTPVAEENKVPFGFIEAIIKCFQNRPFINYSFLIMATRVAISCVLIGVPYLGRSYFEVGETEQSIMLGLVYVVSMLFFPLTPWFLKKFGLRMTYIITLIAAGIILPLLFFTKSLPAFPMEGKVNTFKDKIANYELIRALETKGDYLAFNTPEKKERLFDSVTWLRLRHAPMEEEEKALEKAGSVKVTSFRDFRLSKEQIADLEVLQVKDWNEIAKNDPARYKELVALIPLFVRHAKYEIERDVVLLNEKSVDKFDKTGKAFLAEAANPVWYNNMTPDKIDYLKEKIAPMMVYFPNPILWAFIIFGLMGLPTAILLTAHRPLLGEIIDVDEKLYGYRREAMYFAAEDFGDKLGEIVATTLGGFLVFKIVTQGLNPSYYLYFIVATAISFGIAFVAMLVYPLGKKGNL
jgi:Na+/melibiose symporter-like transporter